MLLDPGTGIPVGLVITVTLYVAVGKIAIHKCYQNSGSFKLKKFVIIIEFKRGNLLVYIFKILINLIVNNDH